MVLVLLSLSAAVAVAQGTTLKYTSWMAGGEDKPVMAAFMAANPTLKVEDEILEGSRYQTLLKTRILGGDVPDVMLVMPDQIQEFARLGLLADLSAEPAIALQKKAPAIDASLSLAGKTYGFSVNGGVAEHPIWYNKVIFKKLGLAEPKTVAEFLAALKKIKAAGIDPVAFGAKDSWPNRWASYWNLTSQVKVAYEKAKTYDVYQAISKGVKPSEVYRDSFAFLAQLVKDGLISKSSLSMSWPESAQYFADGKAALLPQGPWVPGVDAIKAADPAVFELGVFVFPAAPYAGKVYLRAAGDRILVVSAKSKNLAAAKSLFNFFASEANLKTYLSSQTLTSLLPIALDLPPVLNKFVADTRAKGTEVGFHDIALVPPGFEGSLCEAVGYLLAGDGVDKTLARLDTWLADHTKK